MIEDASVDGVAELRRVSCYATMLAMYQNLYLPKSEYGLEQQHI